MNAREAAVAPGRGKAQQRDALTELVKSHVGAGRRWSTREFAEAAVDPVTGWAPSKSLIGKIINDEGYKVTPELVSAIAEGLGLPREVIASAAHFQTIGYTDTELSTGAPATLIQRLHEGARDTPLARGVAEQWELDDADGTADSNG